MARDTIESIYNVRVVDASLGTSGQPSEVQLAAIARAGYRTVINLALHDDPRYSLPDEAATVGSLGMRYVHIPVQFAEPTQANLRAFFDAMDACGGEPVWVHCAANMRVSAFVGLYRVLRQGWDEERAFDLQRDLWQPNATWAGFIGAMLAAHAVNPASSPVVPAPSPVDPASSSVIPAQAGIQEMPPPPGFPPARE